MIPTIIPGARNQRYIFLLAVVAALILVVGALTRPKDEPPAPASDADLANISRLSERRSLEDMTSYFSNIATTAELSLVRLRDLSTSAFAWNADRIVAARIADPFPTKATFETPGGDIVATVALRRPDLPVVSIAAPPAAALVPVRRSLIPVQSGAWIFALWTGSQARSFVYGHALDSVSGFCGEVRVQQIVPSFVLTASMAGGAIVDIDGNVLGLIVPCRDGITAISADSVDMLLADDNSLESQLLSQYGFRAAPLSADEAAYVKQSDGLIVREVWLQYAAHTAGLRPGDVILAIGGAPVVGPGDLLQLIGAAAGGPPDLAVQRGSTRIQMTLHAGEMTGDAERPDRGLMLQAPEGSRIDAVAPDSPAARAGIRPGDRIIRINHVAPGDVNQIRRLLSGAGTRSGPVLMELERGGRRFAVLLQPPA